MEAPEKIYFAGKSAKKTIEMCTIQHLKGGTDGMDVVEYVRSDIAENERNAFAILCYDAGKQGGEMDAKKLYEMFNSRKAQK